MKHLLLISVTILTFFTGCAEACFRCPGPVKSSLPAHVLAQLPLLNIGDLHGNMYLSSEYDGRARSTGLGDPDVGVHYYFHRTEDRLIGFQIDFRNASFPASVKALAERFGPPSETTTRPLIRWGMVQKTINHIAIWHTPDGDLTAVEYEDDIRWDRPGEIRLETKELADIRQEWEREHGLDR